jgi:hypothetical protein
MHTVACGNHAISCLAQLLAFEAFRDLVKLHQTGYPDEAGIAAAQEENVALRASAMAAAQVLLGPLLFMSVLSTINIAVVISVCFCFKNGLPPGADLPGSSPRIVRPSRGHCQNPRSDEQGP